jgi:hypothetical protein
MPRSAFKVFTHDLCPPVQGGPPVWSGELPFVLPPTKLDETGAECGAGWNACSTQEDALRIAGLWPNGRPSRLYRVEDVDGYPMLERGDKLRAGSLRIVEELSTEPAIRALSAKWFGEHAEAMAKEQLAWAKALGRPLYQPAIIEEKLAVALDARKLAWKLKQFDSAWDARAARAACSVSFAARSGWINHPENLLTVGLRDAYENGLAIALPTGPNELGWAMVEAPKGDK